MCVCVCVWYGDMILLFAHSIYIYFMSSIYIAMMRRYRYIKMFSAVYYLYFFYIIILNITPIYFFLYVYYLSHTHFIILFYFIIFSEYHIIIFILFFLFCYTKHHGYILRIRYDTIWLSCPLSIFILPIRLLNFVSVIICDFRFYS